MAYKGPLLRDLRGAKKQQRIDTLAANPATRKAIPTALLPVVYRKARLLNERLAQPVVPGSAMTNRDLARESNAAMDVQYGDQRRLLERQQAQAPDYYDAYLSELKKAQAGATAQGTQTAGAIQNLYSSGPMAPGSNQATLGQAQAGTANLLGQTQANYEQALQNAVQSGKLKALADIGQKRADLAQTEGQANLAYRSKRRSEELQNVATSALAGVKQDTAATAAQTARARVQETHRHNVAEEKKPPKPRSQEEIDRPYLTKYGLTYAQFKAAVAKGQRPKPLSGKKGTGGSGAPGAKDGTFLAPAGQQAVVQRVHKLAQYLNGTQRWEEGPRKGKVMTWSEKVNHLTGKLLEPQNVVDAAASLAQNARQGRKNTLGPSGASALHSAGAQVHGHFKYSGGKKKQ